MKVLSVKPAIAVRDMDEAMDFYSQLVGAKFLRSKNPSAQVEVALDARLGLELVSPLPGGDTPTTRAITETLEKSGDGSVFDIVFTVDDADEFSARAREMGLDGWWVDVDQQEIKELSMGTVESAKEYVIGSDSSRSTWLSFLQVELKTD